MADKELKLAIPVMEEIMGPSLAQKAREKAEQESVRIKLAELREKQTMTQSSLPSFKQSTVSRIENGHDMLLSTLRRYLGSMGMGLEIAAIPRDGGQREVLLHVD
jgi:hypothetical protein